MSEFDPDSPHKQEAWRDPLKAIQKILKPNERILWQAKPIAKLVHKEEVLIAFIIPIPIALLAFLRFASDVLTLVSSPDTPVWSYLTSDTIFSAERHLVLSDTSDLLFLVFEALFTLAFAVAFGLIAASLLKPVSQFQTQVRHALHAITNMRTISCSTEDNEEDMFIICSLRSIKLDDIKAKVNRDSSGSLMFWGKRIKDGIEWKRECQRINHVPNVSEAEKTLRRAIADFKTVKQAKNSSSPSH